MSVISSAGWNGPEAVIAHLRAVGRGIRLAEHLITGTLLTLALVPRRAGRGRTTPPAVVRWWHRRLCRILGIRVRVEGTVPSARGLVVANHVSWIDIPVLGGLLPLDFVSKSEVRRWPLIGWLAAAAGTLFIRRGRGDLGRLDLEMRARLQDRRAVVLFPEGTTTDGSDVRAFFPRLFQAALDAQQAVTPVALRYVADGAPSRVAPFIGDEGFTDHLRRMLREPDTEVLIRFCEPVASAGQTRRGLARQARQEILDALRLMDRSPRSIPAAVAPGHQGTRRAGSCA